MPLELGTSLFFISTAAKKKNTKVQGWEIRGAESGDAPPMVGCTSASVEFLVAPLPRARPSACGFHVGFHALALTASERLPQR